MRGVAVVAKSPRPTSGRIGPLRAQDWYRSCVLAADLTFESTNAFVIVTSAFTAGGDLEEYSEVLAAHNACPVLVSKGLETIGQIEAMLVEAERRGVSELHVVSTLLHTLRVRWYMRKSKIKIVHHVAFGIPRPKEAITDAVLTFAAPIIDMLGLRAGFLRHVEERRNHGVL